MQNDKELALSTQGLSRTEVLIRALSERQQCYMWALFVYCCVSNLIFSPKKKFKSFESNIHASNWMWDCLFEGVAQEVRPVKCSELLEPKSFGVFFYLYLFMHLCLVPFGMVGGVVKLVKANDKCKSGEEAPNQALEALGRPSFASSIENSEGSVMESRNVFVYACGRIKKIYKKVVISKSYLYLEAYLDNLSFCTTSSNWHAMLEDFTNKEVEFFLDLWNANTLLLYISNGWAKSVSMSSFFSSMSNSIKSPGWSVKLSGTGNIVDENLEDVLNLKDCTQARFNGRTNWIYGQYDYFGLNRSNGIGVLSEKKSCELPKSKNEGFVSKNIKPSSVVKQIRLNLGLFVLLQPLNKLCSSAFWQLNFCYFVFKLFKIIKNSFITFGASLLFIVSYYTIISFNMLNAVYHGQFDGLYLSKSQDGTLMNVLFFLFNLLFSNEYASLNSLIKNELFVEKFPELMSMLGISFVMIATSIAVISKCKKKMSEIAVCYLTQNIGDEVGAVGCKRGTCIVAVNNSMNEAKGAIEVKKSNISEQGISCLNKEDVKDNYIYQDLVIKKGNEYKHDLTYISTSNKNEKMQRGISNSAEDPFFLITKMSSEEYKILAFDAMMTSADFNGNSYSFILNSNLGSTTIESTTLVSQLLNLGLKRELNLQNTTEILKKLEEITWQALKIGSTQSFGASFFGALSASIAKQQQTFNNYLIKYIQYNIIEKTVMAVAVSETNCELNKNDSIGVPLSAEERKSADLKKKKWL